MDSTPALKTCCHCKQILPVEMFCRDKNRPDGRYHSCRACLAGYRQINRERRAEYQAKYRQTNKEKVAEHRAAYRQANRERLAEYQAKCYQDLRDGVVRADMTRRSSLRAKDIPQELVELKRAQLQLLRLIKEKTA